MTLPTFAEIAASVAFLLLFSSRSESDWLKLFEEGLPPDTVAQDWSFGDAPEGAQGLEKGVEVV